MSTSLPEIIRLTNLVPPGKKVLVLLSGGGDSVSLLHAMRAVVGNERLAALHVNHGLREAAGLDEEFCLDLCKRLDITCRVEHAQIDSDRGNTEGQARKARYRIAETVRAQLRFDLIATGHTASDQAETMLYRLACSPGRRALLGIAEQTGRIIRPMLSVTRSQAREYCIEAGLDWREDESNQDNSLARNRLRNQVLPVLEEIHPAAELNMVATAAELREESALLDAVVEEALKASGAGGFPPAVEAAQIAGLAAPVRRLLLRRLAERAAGGPVPLTAERVGELERLALLRGSSYMDLPGGVRAACEYGVLRFVANSEGSAPASVDLPVPGSCRFGNWNVRSEIDSDLPAALSGLRSHDEAVLDASKLAGRLRVRSWEDGDRMQPLGLAGSKSLQDLFTDLKVPRALRHTLPVVTSDGEIAWIAGVATSDVFKVTESTRAVVRLRARTGA